MGFAPGRASRWALLAAAALIALAPPPGGALERARAPRFKAKDLSGKTLDLEALTRRGPVLLDFWATWCKPCVASIPELESWHEAYGVRGLTVIGISVDGPRNRGKVRPFVARNGIRYPVVIDEDGRLQQLYRAQAIPTAVLVGRDGAVAFTRIGFRRGESARFEAKIRAALGLESEGEPEGREATGVSVPAPESASDSLRPAPAASDSFVSPERRRDSRFPRADGHSF